MLRDPLSSWYCPHTVLQEINLSDGAYYYKVFFFITTAFQVILSNLITTALIQ